MVLAKNDINLIKSYLCQISLTNDKVNQQLSKNLFCLFFFKFGDMQLLNYRIFSVEPLLLTPSSNNEELPPYDCFFGKLRKINPIEKHYNAFEDLDISGLSVERAVCKLLLIKIPQQMMNTTLICGASAWAKQWNLLKTFSCGTKTKTFFQL